MLKPDTVRRDSNPRPSGYEPEPEVPNDYVGHGSSGFREIEIGWSRLESVGLLAPFLAPAAGRTRRSELIVTDRGRGFREGTSGGLGLGLSIIAEMTTELTIEQAPEGTEVRMRFALAEG